MPVVNLHKIQHLPDGLLTFRNLRNVEKVHFHHFQMLLSNPYYSQHNRTHQKQVHTHFSSPDN